MRKINIFLASSIAEFERESTDLKLFIRNISDRFEDKYNTKIVPLLRDNTGSYISAIGKQSKIEDIISDCEMCFFVIFTKVQDAIRHEFEIAFKELSRSDKKRPKIYVYFKSLDGAAVDSSIKSFMGEIDQTYKHYYSTFNHIDTIKLRILLNLKMQEMDFVNIDIVNDKCLVDGVAMLNVTNVSEFANSQDLKALRAEQHQIEEKYLQMKPIYAKGVFDDAFRKEYVEVSVRRQKIADAIAEIRKQIFNLSLDLSRDEVSDAPVNQRQKEAYRLLALGDVQGCLAVMNSADIDDDFNRWKKTSKAEQKQRVDLFINEHKLAIDVMLSMRNYKGRFEQIVSRYQKITDAAVEYKQQLQMLYYYAEFLRNHNDYSRACAVAEKLASFFGDPTLDISPIVVGETYELLGYIYQAAHRHDWAERSLLAALDVFMPTLKKTDMFVPKLARIYNTIGVLYAQMRNYQEASRFIGLAIAAREGLAKRNNNADEYVKAVADSYSDMAVVYKNVKYYNQACEYFEKSLSLLTNLADKDFERYGEGLAILYNNMGNLFGENGDFKQAIKTASLSVDVYGKLSLVNVRMYEPKLATALSNLALYYANNKQYDEAEKVYDDIKRILTRWSNDVPSVYLNDLARAFHRYAEMKMSQKSYAKAEEYLNQSAQMFSQLAQDNDYFEQFVAQALYNYAVVSVAQNKEAQAVNALKRAKEITFKYKDCNELCRNIYNSICQILVTAD